MVNDWSPSELVGSLANFDWSLSQAAQSAAWQAYLATYNLPSAAEGYQHFAGSMQLADTPNIVVQVWQPAQPTATAIVMHGLYDHVGLYRHLIRYCLQRGWRVLAFDLPGHGLSSGARASVASFQQYDQVFTRILSNISVFYKAPIHVFGQSTGGAIIVNYLLKYGIKPAFSPFASVNLIAPLVRPREWTKIKWLYCLIKLVKKSIPRGRSINSQDQQFLDFLWHNDPLQAGRLGVDWLGAMLQWDKYISQLPASQVPVTIVQGNDDNSVLWRYNLEFLRTRFPQQTVHIIEGGRHHLVNEIQPVRQQMWDVFDRTIHA